MTRRFYWVLIVFVILTSSGIRFAHGAHHDHDEVSHRIFVLDEVGSELVYLDVRAHRVVSSGEVSVSAYTGGMVSERGRFLALVNEHDRTVQVWSSGLVLEEHGDHYDLAALAPQLFWEHRTAGSPSLAASGGQDFLVSNPEHHTIGWLRSQDGLQVIVPNADGPAALDGHHLAVSDAGLRLVDVYDLHTLERLASFRVQQAPSQLAVSRSHLIVAYESGLEIVDLDSLDTTRYGELPLQNPRDVFASPDGHQAFVLVDDGVVQVDVATGSYSYVGIPDPAFWAVNETYTYLSVVSASERQAHVFSLDEHELVETAVLAIPGTSDPRAAVWVGRDLAVAVGQEVVIQAFDGRPRDTVELGFVPGALHTAFIPAEDRVMDDHHHDHDH